MQRFCERVGVSVHVVGRENLKEGVKKIYDVVLECVQVMSPMFHMATQLCKHPITGHWQKSPTNQRKRERERQRNVALDKRDHESALGSRKSKKDRGVIQSDTMKEKQTGQELNTSSPLPLSNFDSVLFGFQI